LYVGLPRIVRQPVEYQRGANRIFIGDVKPARFSLRLEPVPNGARLDIEFSQPLTVHTAASNGKWIVTLGDKPVQPQEKSFSFRNPYISQVQFDDQDGTPKVIITPSEAGLDFYTSQPGSGQTLVADVIKPAAPTTAQQSPS